ncbi:hypothetical protein BVC80_8541g3 [Macleaya cordata]|uniref:Uncharacterized protein n=1 Tax=Macleaya cordata TaxID=56857 RepID=A0A200QQK5_MACCD|nr:hypothetical protein BVC80_8541g3 [Macleaya cordata]
MIIERVITVEYLEPTMSRELLCKFPDHSAFDFDYSQSGIWSPLLPRGGGATTATGRSLTLSDSSSMEIRRKLLDGFDQDTLSSDNNEENLNSNVTTKIKNKIALKMMKKKKKKKKEMKNKSLDLSITPIKQGSSTPQKGWVKVLRAASKQFKKQKSSSLQQMKMMKLPNFLRN